MIKKIVICIIIIFSTSGCYNYQELNAIAILSAVSIDYQDDNFLVSYQIINSNVGNNQNSSSEQAQFVVYEQPAKTLEESARKISLITSKRIYASHLQILILSEEVAKNHIGKVIDFIYRNPEIRGEFAVLVAKNPQSKELLEILTPLVNLSSEDIRNSLIQSNKILGINKIISFSDLLHMYLNPNIEIAVPSIEILGNEDEGTTTDNLKTTKFASNVKLSNMSVFKKNKLVGYLTEEESISYSFIINNLKNTIFNFKCNSDNYISTDIKSINSKLKITKDNQLELEITGDASLVELNCKLDITKDKVVKEINKNLNEAIAKQIINSFRSINNKYQSDIFGIEDLFYKNKNKYYKNIKDDWDEYYKNIELKVISKMQLFSKGTALGGLYEVEN